jgi:hypothetical protein
MKEIMDALSPGHPAQRVVFMKAAQVGATESGNSFVAFTGVRPGVLPGRSLLAAWPRRSRSRTEAALATAKLSFYCSNP